MRKLQIHPTAIIYPNVVICDGVYVGAYSVIGAPAEYRGKELTAQGSVVIGANTVIREHVTIHSSPNETGTTLIGEDCYIMSHSHIGHDAIINNHCTLSSGSIVGGHAILKDYVNMGLNSTLHQRSTMETGSMLGANGFGKGIIKPWCVMVGTPARFLKMNNHLRAKLNLPLL